MYMSSYNRNNLNNNSASTEGGTVDNKIMKAWIVRHRNLSRQVCTTLRKLFCWGNKKVWMYKYEGNSFLSVKTIKPTDKKRLRMISICKTSQ